MSGNFQYLQSIVDGYISVLIDSHKDGIFLQEISDYVKESETNIMSIPDDIKKQIVMYNHVVEIYLTTNNKAYGIIHYCFNSAVNEMIKQINENK